MSLNRFAKRADSNQAEIVKALKAVGCGVWVISKPCDLLVRYYSSAFGCQLWTPMEVKTASNKAGTKYRQDKSSKEQKEFLEESNTPVVMSVDQALRLVGAR